MHEEPELLEVNKNGYTVSNNTVLLLENGHL
jgi:hypothetical protein